MKYNVYIGTIMGAYNLIGLDDTTIKIVIDTYLNGDSTYTISGKLWRMKDIQEIQIFEYESDLSLEKFSKVCEDNGFYEKGLFNSKYLLPNKLSFFGENVTEKFIGHAEYGRRKKIGVEVVNNKDIIDEKRIAELKSLEHPQLDPKKLIQFCKEINSNFKNGNYLSVAMLSRSIPNHVPPIFGVATFTEVSNNYGGPKFQKSMIHLNNSLKNIADRHLHETIQTKEVLPTATQIDFSQELDVLLGEVVKKLS